jgi:hypothetical protein
LQPPENQVLFLSTFDELIALPNSRLKILHKPVFEMAKQGSATSECDDISLPYRRDPKGTQTWHIQIPDHA